MKVRLGDVFTLIRNGASIKQTDGATGIPITRIETISNREIDRNRFGYADIMDTTKYEDYILQDGDILMSHINSETHLGKAALYKKQNNEQIIHGMNLLILRTNKSFLFPQFATYYFETPVFLMQIKRITKKSVNQASFTVSALKEVEIPLPPLDEQRRIAAVLDKVSDLIIKRRAQLDKLDELVKARFVEMFGSPVSNTLGWNQTKLSKVTSKIGSGATPRGGKESYHSEGVSLIRSMNIHDGLFLYKDLAHITDEQARQLDNVAVEDQDVFINITGASVARSCIVPHEVLPARVNQHVAIIRCIQSQMNPIFASNMFINDEFKKQLLEIGESGGATRQAITKQQLQDLNIILPPLEHQIKFATFVNAINQSKLTIQQSLDKLEILKKALMQEYFG